MDFENVKIHGIHVSRYLASFYNSLMLLRPKDGKMRVPYFYEWLEQLTIDGEKLTEEEIEQIYNWAVCGKLELETNAEKYIIRKMREP